MIRHEGVGWKVDLAGFTRFLEDRQERGREGAEEVAVAVTRTFLPLVREIHALNGVLIGFGGDALTAWFPLHSRETLRSFSERVNRRIGEVPLPLQARQIFQRGVLHVHTLPFPVEEGSFFTVYTGPGMQALARREKRVHMGEVWLHPRILMFCNDTLLNFELPSPWAPRHLLQEPSRFQPLAALFVEVRGTERSRLLRTFQNLVRVVTWVEGEVIKGDTTPHGYRWLVVVGFPYPCEDWEDRVREVARTLEGPAIRMGGAFGVAVNLRIASFVDFMGDNLNTAARICGAAPWGEAWMAGKGGKPVELSGKRRAVAVVSARMVQRRRKELPLVGRKNELRLLREALQRFSTGDNVSFSLVGLPGVGKSRLLQAFLEEMEGLGFPFRLLRVPERPHPPWSLVRRFLLSEMGAENYVPLARLRSALREWGIPLTFLPALHAVVNEREVSPEAAQTIPPMLEKVFRALPRRFWVVEDAQWADGASRSLLARLPSFGHTILWVMRKSGVAIPVDREIHVLPLDAESIRRLVQLVLPEGGPVDEIARRAKGIPLFALEMARAWLEGEAWLTPRMEVLVLNRLLRLPPNLQQALRLSAVFGDGMPISLLSSWIPDFDTRALRVLEERGWLVREEETVRFQHDLLREAVYGGMLVRHRRKLHGRIARYLETHQPDRLEVIGYHWKGAGRLARAAACFQEAARRAANRGALEEARSLFDEAEQCLEEGSPGRAMVRWEAQEILFWRKGDLEGMGRALRAFQEAEETRRHTQIRVFLALRACALERERGKEHPGKMLDEVAHLVAAMPQDLQRDFWMERGFVASHTGAYREAVRCFLKARRMDSGHAGEERILLHLAMVLERVGWSRTARKILERLLGTIPPDRISLRIHALNFLANLLKDRDPVQARQAYEKALALAQQYSGPYELAMLLGNLASVEELLGNFPSARKRYEESVEIFREIGHLRGVAYMQGSLGIVQKYMGDLSASRHNLLKALRLARRLHHHVLTVRYLNALGGWYVLSGNTARARKLFLLALRRDPVPVMRAIISINLALLEMEDLRIRQAWTNLQKARQALSRNRVPLVEGYIHWVEALLRLCEGRDDLAAPLLEEARRMFVHQHHRAGVFYVRAVECLRWGRGDRNALEDELREMGVGEHGELRHVLEFLNRVIICRTGEGTGIQR